MEKKYRPGGLYMKLSTRTKYGTQLLLHLALNRKKRIVSLHEIAELENISEKYLSKIIIPLRQAGLVKSVRGAHGGYVLVKEPAKITLKDIIELLDGKIEIMKNLKTNNDQVGVKDTADFFWKDINSKIVKIFISINLADLVKKYNE